MAGSLKCRLTGCDRDPCGVCRRCGDATGARHAWQDTERDKPCYRNQKCERCGAEKQSPDHDWQAVPGSAETSALGTIDMKCARCGLVI